MSNPLQFPDPPQGEHRGFRWDSRRWDRRGRQTTPPVIPKQDWSLALPQADYNLDFRRGEFLWNGHLYTSMQDWLDNSGVTYQRGSAITVTNSRGEQESVGAGMIAINHHLMNGNWVPSGMVDDGSGRLTLPAMLDLSGDAPRDFSFGISVSRAVRNPVAGPMNLFTATILANGTATGASALGFYVIMAFSQAAERLHVRPDDRAQQSGALNTGRVGWPDLDLQQPYKAVTTCRSMMPAAGSLQYTSVNGSPQQGRSITAFPTDSSEMVVGINGELRAVARNRVYMTEQQLQAAST